MFLVRSRMKNWNVSLKSCSWPFLLIAISSTNILNLLHSTSHVQFYMLIGFHNTHNIIRFMLLFNPFNLWSLNMGLNKFIESWQLKRTEWEKQIRLCVVNVKVQKLYHSYRRNENIIITLCDNITDNNNRFLCLWWKLFIRSVQSSWVEWIENMLFKIQFQSLDC